MTVSSLVALAWVLSRFLLDGNAADLGPSTWNTAPAFLALGVGLGLLFRSRLPRLADAVLLALLVPARGPLCDAVMASAPTAWGATHLAAAVSLLPAGFVLGRQLWPVRQQASLVAPLLGWIAGALLVECGAVAWLPGPFTGFVMAGALVALGQLGRSSRGDGLPSPTNRVGCDEQPSPPDRVGWEGLPVGAALALTLGVLSRVIPSFAEPGTHLGSELVLGLTLPALPVAFFSALLVSGKGRRPLFALGCLVLAAALWQLALALGVYSNGPILVALTRQLRNFANSWLGQNEFRAWLLHFCGPAAVGWGLLAGGASRRVAGPLLLGSGLGLLAGQWVLWEPTMAPLHLLLLAAGLSGAAWLLPFSRRWGALLLPAAVLPLLLFPDDARLGYDSVRRLGDYATDGWTRSLIGDVALFSTGTREIPSVDGRRAALASFTGRRPLLSPDLSFDDEPLPDSSTDTDTDTDTGTGTRSGSGSGSDTSTGNRAGTGSGSGTAGPPPPLGPPSEEQRAAREASSRALVQQSPEQLAAGVPEDDDEDAQPERFFGLRFAGTPLSPDQDPVGPEGSLGRGWRLFAPEGHGPALVLGVGAELLLADLHRDDPSRPLLASSEMPLGLVSRLVLLKAMGLEEPEVSIGHDPRNDLEGLDEASLQLVLVAPERLAWPLGAWASGRAALSRLVRLLAPGGRCLAFLDTDGMDGRALRARLAAFGAVFGERSLALVEPRELAAPLVLLVGWCDRAGAPRAGELAARLPWPDHTGFRAPLRRLSDLGALLLADGVVLARLADSGPVLDRGRPVPTSRLGGHGWAAVASVLDVSSRLSRSIAGAPQVGPLSAEVAAGLAAHEGVFYQLERLRGAMLVEPLDDVDWAALDAEVEHYARAAAEHPDDPLLMAAVAALLEPLVREAELSRFASIFERVHGEALPWWRIALQQSAVLHANLLEDQAQAALTRARDLAGQ